MVFVNAQGPIPSMDFAFPDVCKTPVLGVPVPLPYPNIALGPTAIPTQFTVLLQCMPAHNMATTKPMSLGDTPGLMGGVVSQLVMGPERHLKGSLKLFIGGPPATRMLDPSGQNGMLPNDPGVTLSPAQVTVMSLS